LTGSSINFHLEELNYRIRNIRLLKLWISQSVSKEARDLGNLNIVLCTDDYLHKMNVEHLDHDTLTDIITFNYNEDSTINGDLFISLDRVRDNAQELSENLTDELHRVMIHGVLHLCGYKDKSLKDSELMREKEDFYLSLRPF
jgi:probable rRNA maturation factor